jgi:peptide/nickel transport system permease protein
MGKYLLRRLGTSVVILLGVSILIFALIHLQPGNPYSGMIDPSVPPKVVEQKLRQLGYYDPIPVQYLKWLGRVLTGDFGYSIQYKAPALNLIWEALKNTLLLSVVAFVLSSVLAVTAGIFTAAHSNSAVDRVVTLLSFAGVSIPTFFFGLLLVKWLGYDLALLPSSGMTSLRAGYTGSAHAVDVLRHMVMPVLVLGLSQTATLLRYTRSAVLDALNQDYIRTARAKGLTWNRAVWTHGLRNSMISIITVLCMQLPQLFSGALITETIFVWPGIGTLNYNAILRQDYPLIMGIAMMLAVVILLANLLADILYALADPRIRLNREV